MTAKPPTPGPRLYGLMAEFHEPGEIVAAARAVRAEGYRNVDAYSPFPIEELNEALGFHRSWLPPLVLAGGIAGAIGGFALQYWASVIEYPMNIGGKPYLSWPAFVPPAFETTILMAALTAVLGMLALNGLPEPYHPVFNVPSFALASRDRFFLCIETSDPKFDDSRTRAFLSSLGPSAISEVEP